MQHHFIHVSGLIDQADLPSWARQGLASGLLRWAEPQDALNGLSSEEAPGELWWFYAPPWSALGRVQALAGQRDDSAAPWATVHRQLLRARQIATVPVRLLSALHTPPVSLVAEALQPFTGMESLPSGSIEELVSTLEAELIQSGAPHDDMGVLLAQLHAWVEPEVWDVLEALEAANWDSSRTPLMREDVSPPEPAAVAHLAQLLAAGERAPMVEAAVLDAKAALDGALVTHRQEVSYLKQQMAAQATELDQKAQAQEATQGQLKEAQEEGELLLLQLHQVQEELEQIFLQGKDKEAAHAREMAAARAQSAEQVATAETAVEKIRQEAQAAQQKYDAELNRARTDAQHELTAAKEESELLTMRLSQLKDELDQARAQQREAESAVADALANAQAATEQAHSVAEAAQLQAQLAMEKLQAELTSAEQACYALTEERDQAMAAAEDGARQVQALQGDLQEAQLSLELAQLSQTRGAEEFSSLRTDRDRALAELDRMKKEAAEQLVAAEVVVEKTHLEAQASLLQAQAAYLGEVDALHSRLALAEQERNAARERESQLTEALHKTREVLNASQMEMQAWESEREQMLRGRHQAEEDAAQARREIQALVDSHAAALADHQHAQEQVLLQMRQQRDQLLLELHRAHEELQDFEKAREEALAQVASAQALTERARLETEVAQQDLEAARLKTEETAQQLLAAQSLEQEALSLRLRETEDAIELLRQKSAEADATAEELLLELKQSHEELDARAVRAQELEAQLQATSERYRRLQSRYPQAVDVDSVAIAAVDRHALVPAIAWRLHGLCVGGTVWPELVLRTTLEPGGAGVRLETAAGAVPLAGMDAPLVPKALVARQPGQLERFRGMGQQAWQLLVGACAAVDQALAAASGAVPGAPAGFDLAFWRQSLGTLAPALNALPPVFRHDGVRLRSERRASRYEHLWLEFEGAGYGSARLPGFSLRLAAVTGQGEAFSHLPQIEVPATPAGAPPFAGWFAVSRDDYGPNLELRADTQRQAFDLAAWQRLPKEAQAMLLSAIAALPAALKALQSSGREVSRPWLDWAQLLDGLMSAMRGALNAMAATGTTAAPAAKSVPVVALAAPPAAALLPAQAVLQGAALNPDLYSTAAPLQPAASAQRTARGKAAGSAKVAAVEPVAAPTPKSTPNAAPKAALKASPVTAAPKVPNSATRVAAAPSKKASTAKKAGARA
jgi:chemotaxis protein histidine kinase CheA